MIRAGEFMMGSPDENEGRRRNEGPRHRVTIGRRFAIGRYPVTFDEYDRFCEAKEQDKPADQGWGRERRPVINVSWDDAQAYVAWLSQETGKTYRLPVGSGMGICLPGWHDNPVFVRRRDHARERQLSAILGLGRTSEVGAYPANPWRIHDMHGNVWEWMEDDWHENYQSAPIDGSAWKDREQAGIRAFAFCAAAPGAIESEGLPVCLPRQGRHRLPGRQHRVPSGPNTFLIPETLTSLFLGSRAKPWSIFLAGKVSWPRPPSSRG